MTCDCPAFIFARKGRPRECRHVKEQAGAAARVLVGIRDAGRTLKPVTVSQVDSRRASFLEFDT